jgi:hypothetical protein
MKQPGDTLTARKFLLADAMRYLDDQEDSAFSTMAGWHNKTFWLIVSALMLIIGLSYEIGNERLFLLGAAGGLLSRLTYSLYRSNVPTDYGASWSKIFLSPVVGALTGWGGVMLLYFAFEIGIAGSLFDLDWCAQDLFVYAIAVVMGFSERFFTGILTQLEEQTAKKAPDSSKAKPGSKGTDQSANLSDGAKQENALHVVTDRITELDADHNFDCEVKVAGGKPPYIFSGTLPNDLTWNQQGHIVGVLRDHQATEIVITVTDQDKKSVQKKILLR